LVDEQGNFGLQKARKHFRNGCGLGQVGRPSDAGGGRNARQMESFFLQVVSDPLPNVSSGLVVVGSDKRGTIYGIYDLSEQIGVSPWYWWADVPVRHKDALFVKPGKYRQGEPAVKYRGIFLNDEAPDLTFGVSQATLTTTMCVPKACRTA